MEKYAHFAQLHKLLLHPFNGLFSRTAWVSRYQKGKTSLDSNEARDDGFLGWQWHQLDHMQTICILLQTDKHTSTSSLSYRPDALPDAQPTVSNHWRTSLLCTAAKNIYAQLITIKVTTGHHHHHHGNSGSSCANILTAAIVSRSNTLQQYRHAFALPYFVWHSSNTHRETYELLYYRRLTASFPGQPG